MSFRPINRQTDYLFPPSMNNWLPEKHLARFVVETVEEFDLTRFVSAYRSTGSASYHPSLLLSLLIYGYATHASGDRSPMRRASWAHPILVGGSEELKRRYLPQLASGKRLAAFGLTEANAGSDASGIRTEARRDGDYYVMSGTKQWITNGGEADIYSVMAITDRSKGGRGATGFVLEKGMDGLSFVRAVRREGHPARTPILVITTESAVDVKAAALIAAGLFAGGLAGAYLANRLPGPWLRLLFGLFTVGMGGYLIYGACRRLGWF